MAENDSCKGSHGEKIEQRLFIIQALCLTLKTFLHQLLRAQTNHAQPNVEKKS